MEKVVGMALCSTSERSVDTTIGSAARSCGNRNKQDAHQQYFWLLGNIMVISIVKQQLFRQKSAIKGEKKKIVCHFFLLGCSILANKSYEVFCT